MPLIKRSKELFDEHHEYAAVVVAMIALGLILSGHVGEIVFLLLMALSLITWLGPKYYAGVRFTKDGFEIDETNKEQDE